MREQMPDIVLRPMVDLQYEDIAPGLVIDGDIVAADKKSGVLEPCRHIGMKRGQQRSAGRKPPQAFKGIENAADNVIGSNWTMEFF